VNANAILNATREMLIVVMLLMSPFLLVAVLTSFVVGLFQASTRLNDLTLSFIPRFAAVMLVVYFTASWVAGQMTGYIERSASAMQAILE
jgi:flagellar biosynthesis protein FliQ